MEQKFYSNGKLLITGEYVVLDGATALAIPTKYGQDLCVEWTRNRVIKWKSFDSDGSVWFEDSIAFDEVTTLEPQLSPTIKNTLREILHAAYLLNPKFIEESQGYTIETHLTFPRFWGLGTSSTLINNIAQWLQINAFDLLKNSFGGSGYDIACAQSRTPILYKLEGEKPLIESVDFNPSFSKNLFFVYLNRKQSSKAAISSYYMNRHEDLGFKIKIISQITQNALVAESAGVFSREMEKHENLISEIVEMQTVKETFFQDFPGVIKSLGGWGGDFILVISKDDPSHYFKKRGFTTIIPYDEMILK